jgi:iron complex outermembrane receptor protein
LQDFLLLLNETMEFPRRFINGGEILTRGVELSLGYDLVRSEKTTWNTSLMLSSFQSTIQSYFAPGTLGGDLGFPGQRGTFTTIIREGEPIGQLWGPVYEGVGPGGEPIFADLNGDGQVLAGPGNALDENGDFQNLGNSRPSLELGWANQCSFGNWSVSALFRGAFGHSLVNTPRVFYEPRFTVNSAYNFVNTELAIEGLNTARFSSLYVERADFLRLDFLTIQRKINFRNSTRSLSLSLTGQNLFVLTNYTGVDPEPALVYTDAASDNQATASINKEYLSPGIDSRSTYWPARSLVFGLQFNW